MEISIITLLMIVFAIFAYTKVIIRMKKGEITNAECAFSSTLWIGVIVVALIPSFATRVAEVLGIGRGVDAMIYLSILVLFYLVFRVYVKIEKIEHEITLLTRRFSFELSKYDIKKKK
ncbi:DUF2304 family protein [Candidatus Woesearchaeota archaeon]|nr:DUF2304 family protein [Candidatus Woesearchaeota archaeon]